MSEREPLVDAVAAYMALMDAVGTEMRPDEDGDLVARLSQELDDAVVRHRARTRARQEAAKEQQRA